MSISKKVVVIGAGIGGLSTAALLARAGLDVTVLEAHIYPGGSAGTFYYQGFRFDAGATLAGGFYEGGPMDLLARSIGVDSWGARKADPAMIAHLPDGSCIPRYEDDRRWGVRETVFGANANSFWEWQERTADALWKFALRSPSWPPQSMKEFLSLLKDAYSWIGEDLNWGFSPGLLGAGFRKMAFYLKDFPQKLLYFVDGQLLISAQTTSELANALYGAAALDLPRRGVVHLEGGMGSLSDTLVQNIRRNGGEVHFRQQVQKLVAEKGRIVAVETKRGDDFPADIVVVNLPPWSIVPLLGDSAPPNLKKLTSKPVVGWGAFVVYVGLDAGVIPNDFPLHHQILGSASHLAEGNSIFLSVNPSWDMNRAPIGKRAITISTHTSLDPWWELLDADHRAYKVKKELYTNRVLSLAEKVVPGIREAADLILPGTPVTYHRFTRRHKGWVGGFPQTSLFRSWGPKLMPNLWMVGDSIFPGQSTAGVTLGGMRVAQSIFGDFAGFGDRRVSQLFSNYFA